MAYTQTWAQAISLMVKSAKGSPDAATKLLLANLVSSAMWRSYPWRDSITNIPAGLIPLVDHVQDYSSPTNFFRLLSAYIMQTNLVTIPDSNQKIDLEVESGDLAPEPREAGWSSITRIAMSRSIGKLRLDYTVSIKLPVTAEIRGEYQMQSTKITDVNSGLWFNDDYIDVAVEGLNYWAYKMADYPRATVGEVTTDGRGRVQYTGQLGTFMLKIRQMAEQEQLGGDAQMYPLEGSIGSDINTGRGWLYP